MKGWRRREKKNLIIISGSNYWHFPAFLLRSSSSSDDFSSFFAHNFTLNFHQLWIRFLAPEVNKDSHFPVASAISRRGSGKASVKNFINHWLGILADDGGSLMEQDNFSHPHTEPGQRKASFVNFSWNRKVCRWRSYKVSNRVTFSGNLTSSWVQSWTIRYRQV